MANIAISRSNRDLKINLAAKTNPPFEFKSIAFRRPVCLAFCLPYSKSNPTDWYPAKSASWVMQPQPLKYSMNWMSDLTSSASSIQEIRRMSKMITSTGRGRTCQGYPFYDMGKVCSLYDQEWPRNFRNSKGKHPFEEYFRICRSHCPGHQLCTSDTHWILDTAPIGVLGQNSAYGAFNHENPLNLPTLKYLVFMQKTR